MFKTLILSSAMIASLALSVPSQASSLSDTDVAKFVLLQSNAAELVQTADQLNANRYFSPTERTQVQAVLNALSADFDAAKAAGLADNKDNYDKAIAQVFTDEASLLVVIQKSYAEGPKQDA